VSKESDTRANQRLKRTGRISEVFGTLKRKGTPRDSLKKMKEIIEKGWAGQLKL
jgi:hypothetical protein